MTSPSAAHTGIAGHGYPSSTRPASDLTPPPAGPAPGAGVVLPADPGIVGHASAEAIDHVVELAHQQLAAEAAGHPPAPERARPVDPSVFGHGMWAAYTGTPQPTGEPMAPAEAARHRMAAEAAAEAAAWLAAPRVRTRPTVDYGTNAAPSHEAMVELAAAAARVLVDCGDASWCPSCDGTGTITYPKLGGRPGTFVNVRRTCTRCRGGRLNPFHGCTFNAVDPCQCTDRCQAWTATHPHT